MNQDIATVQQLLVNHGFAVGQTGVDGVWGPASQRALVAALQVGLNGAASQDPDDEDVALVAELRVDEGTVLHAYQDDKGYWTIGTGRLIDKRRGGGITGAESDYLLRNDLRDVDRDLDTHLPWWRGLDVVRRRALRNLMFNMGWGDGDHGLSSFKNTLKALEARDYDRAAVGFATSKWATDVQPSRRDRIVRQIRTGA